MVKSMRQRAADPAAGGGHPQHDRTPGPSRRRAPAGAAMYMPTSTRVAHARGRARPFRHVRLEIHGVDDQRRESRTRSSSCARSSRPRSGPVTNSLNWSRARTTNHTADHRNIAMLARSRRGRSAQSVVAVRRPDRARLPQREHQRRAVGEGAEHVDEQESDADRGGHEPLPGGYAVGRRPARVAASGWRRRRVERRERRADRPDGCRRHAPTRSDRASPVAFRRQRRSRDVERPGVQFSRARRRRTNVPRKDSRAKVTGAALLRRRPACARDALRRDRPLHHPARADHGAHVHRRPRLVIADYRDIPGRNVVALIDDDQPCLAEREVRHVAEPVLLLAHGIARRWPRPSARRRIEYDRRGADLRSRALDARPSRTSPSTKGDLAAGLADADSSSRASTAPGTRSSSTSRPTG